MGRARTYSAAMAGGWVLAPGGWMSGLSLERWSPYGATLLLTYLWWEYAHGTFPADAAPLIGATGTVSAVLVGFLITAKTVVLGLIGTPMFKMLVRSGHDKQFYRYLFEAEGAGILLLVVSVLGFFVLGGQGGAPNWYTVVWMLSALAALSLFTRALILLFVLLRRT